MTRSLGLLVLCLISVVALTSGCQQVCENIPTQHAAEIRIINSIPDVPTLHVYIDGKLLQNALYDVGSYPLFSVNPDSAFGYHDFFKQDGTLLTVGRHHVTAIAAVGDTVSDTTVLISDHRQTLVYLGKHRATAAEHPVKFIYLDDNTRSPDPNKTLARFVHGVTDLAGLDVYFSQHVKYNAQHEPVPDLTIDYGQVSDESGTGTGTGTSATDYFPIPTKNNDGLLITSKGDTSNVVLLITIPFNSNKFFATVVVRGESKPIDHEPIVSALVLEDGSESQGTFNYSVESFGVRLVNATTNTQMSLLAKGPNDLQPRSNIPLQNNVLFVHEDSVSRYMPLNPTYHGNADFYLDSSADLGQHIVYQFHRNSVVNTRYTFVAIDTTPAGVSSLVLTDTMSLPANHRFGRVRFVNTTAAHVMNFTFNGQSYSLSQGQVAFADAPVGHYSIAVGDGALSGVGAFDLPGTEPLTVFFMPPSSRNEFPITAVEN